MIADEGADEESRQAAADRLLEPRERARTRVVETLDRGTVLEEEHRPAPVRMRVGCGRGHALVLSTAPAVPLHP